MSLLIADRTIDIMRIVACRSETKRKKQHRAKYRHGSSHVRMHALPVAYFGTNSAFCVGNRVYIGNRVHDGFRRRRIPNGRIRGGPRLHRNRIADVGNRQVYDTRYQAEPTGEFVKRNTVLVFDH